MITRADRRPTDTSLDLERIHTRFRQAMTLIKASNAKGVVAQSALDTGLLLREVKRLTRQDRALPVKPTAIARIDNLTVSELRKIFGPFGLDIAQLIAKAGELDIEDCKKVFDLGPFYDSPNFTQAKANAAVVGKSRGPLWLQNLQAGGPHLVNSFERSEEMRRSANYALRGAFCALSVRDLLARDDYNALSLPWRKTIGPIHKDDAGEH